jgi:hypothetical protein
MRAAWDLPMLPLTGIYVDSPENYGFDNFHNEVLLFCSNCEHMQLSNAVDPGLLYLETYSHRTSESPISTAGNMFFKDQMSRLLGERRYRQVLEIGCNDGLLLRSVCELADNLAGFDPVLENVVQKHKNVKFIGGFGETIEYDVLIEEKIDLVVSAHTFEHIVDPRVTLGRLAPFLAKEFDVLIEVPSSISMVDQIRMDQVFPQHVNYYSPSSMQALLAPIGLSLVGLVRNYKYWGGTQILHFSNRDGITTSNSPRLEFEKVLSSIKMFEGTLRSTVAQLSHGDFTRYAYGAAQMLPILKYHLGEVFEEKLTGILDDNPSRIGKYFPSINLPIIDSASTTYSGDQILITALDSAKALVSKAIDGGAVSIIVPTGIL